MIKKLCLLFVISISLIGCTNLSYTNENIDTSTSVKVISLSYNNPYENVSTDPFNQVNRLSLDNQSLNNINYIYPGDIFTFTVELEDPNFEFLSLLSITFNDQVIRGNVDDSILSTRDCGGNICIDFPFEIQSGISNYSIQEVKFAKLNTDVGIRAIIEDRSNNTVTLDVYEEEIYPYVRTSVDHLNNTLSILTFYNENNNFTSLQPIIEDWNRIMIIDNFDASLQYAENINLSDDFTSNIGSIPQRIGILDNGVSFEDGGLVEKTHLFINIYDEAYQDLYFFHIGNSIYVHIDNEDYLIIEMGQRTLIRSVSQDDFYTQT